MISFSHCINLDNYITYKASASSPCMCSPSCLPNILWHDNATSFTAQTMFCRQYLVRNSHFMVLNLPKIFHKLRKLLSDVQLHGSLWVTGTFPSLRVRFTANRNAQIIMQGCWIMCSSIRFPIFSEVATGKTLRFSRDHEINFTHLKFLHVKILGSRVLELHDVGILRAVTLDGSHGSPCSLMAIYKSFCLWVRAPPTHVLAYRKYTQTS